MRIVSFLRNTVLALMLLALVAGVLFVALPWPKIIESRLKDMAAAQGLKNVQLTVKQVSPAAITLAGVQAGDPPTLRLNELTIDFIPQDLIRGRLRTVTLNGLAVTLRQAPGGWQLDGLAPTAAQPEAAAFSLPLTIQELAALPLEKIGLHALALQVAGPALSLQTTLEGTLDIKSGQIETSATGLSGQMDKTGLTTGPFSLKAKLNEAEKRWQGTWRIDGVTFQKIEFPLPPLTASGTLTADATSISLNGRVQSTDKTHGAAFAYKAPLDGKGTARLTVSETTLPWNGGTISARSINVPLGTKQPLKVTLDVSRVPIGQLLQDLTGKKATATGVVSGTLPLTLMPNGEVRVEQGKLQADEPGIISLDPEAIPGDQEQIALVRSILKNLHYKLLSIEVQNEKDNKMTVKLALEGQNPEIEAGRPVKLNVHLSGDVLDFIQNSVTTITDPKKLLQQGRDAKP